VAFQLLESLKSIIARLRLHMSKMYGTDLINLSATI